MNNSNKPIFVSISTLNDAVSIEAAYAYVDTVLIAFPGMSNNQRRISFSFVVPVGSTYTVYLSHYSGHSIVIWSELS